MHEKNLLVYFTLFMKYRMLDDDPLSGTIKVEEYGNGKGRLKSLTCVNQRRLSSNKKKTLPCSACVTAVHTINLQHGIDKMKLVEYVLNEIGASKATQEGVVAIKKFKRNPLKHRTVSTITSTSTIWSGATRTSVGWKCRDISNEIDDGRAMVNAMVSAKAKDYKCLG
jgi:hypothetical protein